MKVVLSNTSGVPIYEQISRQIITSIVSGDLAEGESLPSLRSLARDLHVSVITTTRAYQDLAKEGFIANVPGKGSYVLPRNPDLMRERVLTDTEAALEAAVQVARTGGLARQDVIDILTSGWAENLEEQ